MATKTDVLRRLDAGYTEFRTELNRLSDEQRNERWLGSWGMRELLAHMSGWHEEMAAGLERLARGERPTPEGVDYSDADAWNATFAQQAAATPADALARFEETHRKFRAAIEAVADDRFGEGKTVNRIADMAGVDHYKEHLDELRAWLGTQTQGVR